MSSFTSQLREVIWQGGGDRGQDYVYRSVGLDAYPIFDEAYRKPLNDKIIRAYYNEEIGFETASLFRNAMRSRMELEMPYYNGMYESEKLFYDPLSTVDYSTISDTTQDTTADTSGTSITNGYGSAKGEQRTFSYPQQQLRSDGEYMTSASQSDNDTDSKSESDEQSTQKSKATGKAETRVTGRQQSGQALIAAYRDTLVSVDSMVVDMLSDLFMGVWSTGQAFTSVQNDYPYYNHYYYGI